LAQIERQQRHDVALAGFIDNDDVKARCPRIEVFDHARQRHDPHRHGVPAFTHFASRFGAQQGNPYAGSLTDATDGIEPADQRLALRRRRSPGLVGPRAPIDEINRGLANLLAQFFALALQRLDGNTGTPLQFVTQAAPDPGALEVAGNLSAAMNTFTTV